MWSGSDNGVIKIWPWESIEKSLSLSPEDKHMAALLVERSFIDLKSQVTVNGQCRISSSDIKCLLSDHVRAKVWCAQSLSFSLWDDRSKELLKVFNVEGQIENRVDMGQTGGAPDQPAEDEMKVKFVSTSKKEKSGGFLQRSRNAIMGAADAVHRVATKGAGAFVDDAKRTEALVLSPDGMKRTEALVLSPDGMIWSGSANGMLVQWDGNGTRLRDLTNHPCAVQCFCTHGTRIYVGYVSGIIQVMDFEGNLIAGWVSHSSPVIKMAYGNGYIFTSPGPIDDILRTELAAKESIYARRDSFRILMGTWKM